MAKMFVKGGMEVMRPLRVLSSAEGQITAAQTGALKGRWDSGTRADGV